MGGKGSGGHNKKTLEQHLREGTYRPDRHGALPKRLAAKYGLNDSVILVKKLDKQQVKKQAESKPAKPATNHIEAQNYPIQCPSWFDEYAWEEFERVCQVLYDLGTLQDVNHATLEGYCAAYSRAVRAELELNKGFGEEVTLFAKNGESYTIRKKKNEVAIAEKAWGQVKMFAVELGITTAKGKIEEPEEKLTPLERICRAAVRKSE